MRLVDDDRVVATQLAVAVDLVQQDAVGHHLDAGRLARPVGEAHLVADQVSELDAELLGDALCDRAGGDAARLRVRDALASELQADLRQLRRLARAGRTGDDHDLVVADCARDLLALPGDGQLGGVGDHGKHSPPSYAVARGRSSGRTDPSRPGAGFTPLC